MTLFAIVLSYESLVEITTLKIPSSQGLRG